VSAAGHGAGRGLLAHVLGPVAHPENAETTARALATIEPPAA